MAKVPGERIAKWIHEGTQILVPRSPGQHWSYWAASEPYEEGGEWWVDATDTRGDYSDPFPVGLHEVTLPI